GLVPMADLAAGTGLFTDHYELTMLSAALADGTAERPCTFEVFGRRLPESRRFGVVAGTGRLLSAIADFRFAEADLAALCAAGVRPLIEMGSRRTHEAAAVAAARAAYLVGFTATSNLAAGACYGVPTTGTAAHAFTLLHDTEEAAFAAQVASLGVDTTLLVDTYDIRQGIETAVRVAGPNLGAVRIDSGDLAVIARQARDQLDSL